MNLVRKRTLQMLLATENTEKSRHTSACGFLFYLQIGWLLNGGIHFVGDVRKYRDSTPFSVSSVISVAYFWFVRL